MSVLEDIKPFLEQIKSTTNPDEVIFFVVSFLDNDNNANELSADDYISVSRKIIETNPDAQLAAEIARILFNKKSLIDVSVEILTDKLKYTGDDWSIEQFDKIQMEVLPMISKVSDILFIESNTMLGADNDWGAPEVEQWGGIYKGHDFLLDRIYKDPQEPESGGHILYDSFRWDWAELPNDEIIDSKEIISNKIGDNDLQFYF